MFSGTRGKDRKKKNERGREREMRRRQKGENESKRASWTRESLPRVYLKLKQ